MSQTVKMVTGGCGFVGRHLIKNLLADGAEVWIVDNLFTGVHPDEWLGDFTKRQEPHYIVYEQGSARVVFIEADAIDFFKDQLAEQPAVKLPPFSEVYHLAAIVGGRAVLIEEDPLMVATNHIIDSLFFQWAARNKDLVGNVLYISTSVSYPFALQDRGKHTSMKEEYLSLRGHGNVGLPDSIYGWVKLAGEYLATVAHDRYGLSVVCVRPFSGYGDDQDLDYPIPSIAARVARHENPLVVWGSGDQGRDFIYIDDFVSALRVAIANIRDASGVNIGLGQLTTFKQVAQILAEIEGYSPEVKGLTDKAEGSFAVYGDTTLLKSLGWQPRHTVRDGLAKVLDTVKSRLNAIQGANRV